MSNNGATAAGAILSTMADFGEGFFDRMNALGSSKSLASVSNAMRVEPAVYLDESIRHIPQVSDVLQIVQNSIAAMYLLAVETLTTQINGINVTQILAPLNPHRDPEYAGYIKNLAKNVAREGELFNTANYRFTLPQGEHLAQLARESEQIQVSATADSRLNQAVMDASNLATGKMLRVEVGPASSRQTFNVQLRLRITSIADVVLQAMVGDPSMHHNWVNRLEDFVRGDLSGADFFFCRDVFRARKRLLAKDKTDLIRQVRERQLNHKKAGVLTGKGSLNEKSNVYVISASTAEGLGAKFGLNMAKFEHRQTIFNNTAALMLVVVDQDEERAQFYTDTVRDGTSLSFADLKQTSNKGQGPSIMDIFAAYKEGANPRY